MTTPKVPPAPPHLSTDAAAWWSSVAAEYVIAPHLFKVLTTAAECLDVIADATARIEADGMFTADRFGQTKAHPAVIVARDGRIAFARLVRELNLAALDPDVRPPRVGGGTRSTPRGKAARRGPALDESKLEHLATGMVNFAGEGFTNPDGSLSDDLAREAWKLHGADIFAELTAAYPKRVLWAVKKFGAPLVRAKRPGGAP